MFCSDLTYRDGDFLVLFNGLIFNQMEQYTNDGDALSSDA